MTRAYHVEAEGGCVLEWRTRVLRGVIERGKTELEAPCRAEITLRLPAVRARVELVHELQLKQGDRVLGECVATIALHPDSILRDGLPAAEGKQIGVVDDGGGFAQALKRTGAPFVPVRLNVDLRQVGARVVVCGPNQSVSPAEPWPGVREFILQGGAAIFLEQREPLTLPWLDEAGRWGLEQRACDVLKPLFKSAHPLLRDVSPDDLINWAGLWGRTGPAFSWPEWPRCRAMMADGGAPALPVVMEVWGGGGRTVLCQGGMGRRIEEDPAAQILLRNLIEYCRAVPAPRVQETRMAVSADAIRRGKFDTARFIAAPDAEAVRKSHGLIVALTREGDPGVGPGFDLAKFVAEGGRVVVQSAMGDEMIAALNGLVLEVRPADPRLPPLPRLVAKAPEDGRVECDYGQPLAWGLAVDRVERALAGADGLRAVGGDRPSPEFHVAVKPGVLSALQCGKGRIVLCAAPVDDPDNVERAWLLRQAVNNAALFMEGATGYPVKADVP